MSKIANLPLVDPAASDDVLIVAGGKASRANFAAFAAALALPAKAWADRAKAAVAALVGQVQQFVHFGADVTAAGADGTRNYIYTNGVPIAESGLLGTVDLASSGAGNIDLFLMTRSGENFSIVSTFRVSLLAGVTTGLDITDWKQTVTAGVHYLGVRSNDAGPLPRYRPAIGSQMLYYIGTATTEVPFTPANNYQVLIGGSVIKAFAKTLSERVAANENDVAKLRTATAGVSVLSTTGASDLASAAAAGGAGVAYVRGAPAAQSGSVSRLNARVVGAGRYVVLICTKAGTKFSTVASLPVMLADGMNTAVDISDIGFSVTAGTHYIGLLATENALCTYRQTTGATQWYMTGAPSADGSTLALVNGYEFLVSIDVLQSALPPIDAKISAVAATVASLSGSGTIAGDGYLQNVDRVAMLSTGWNATIAYGQSLAEGFSSGLTSTTQPYVNVTFGGGPRAGKPGNVAGAVNTVPGTTTIKRLVEDNVSPSAAGYYGCGETICSASTTELNTRAARDNGIPPAALVQFASTAAHGAYPLASLVKGSVWYNQMIDHVTEAMTRAKEAGVDFQLTDVPFFQGEADADINRSRASYLTTVLQLRRDIETDYQVSMKAAGGSIIAKTNPVHMFTVQLSTWGSGGTGVTFASIEQIALAQADADRVDPRSHIVAPGYPFARVGDKVHLTGLEEMRAGRYIGRARKQVLVDFRQNDRFRFLSAIGSGRTLTIRCAVPTAPIVIDTSIGSATDRGMQVKDDAGILTITDIAIAGSTITLTLNRDLGANARFRYALDYAATGAASPTGPIGNLRDSTVDSFKFGGVTYNTPHWALMSELTVSVLEAL